MCSGPQLGRIHRCFSAKHLDSKLEWGAERIQNSSSIDGRAMISFSSTFQMGEHTRTQFDVDVNQLIAHDPR